ncbi:hypothetical protein VNO77_27354 [Canavalia gladiata]|uniref:Uncharacterized protein n=1 Tax=Canavalia gladiata TaxID=3824 RepID=A0AAN9KWT4_CANGL
MASMRCVIGLQWKALPVPDSTKDQCEISHIRTSVTCSTGCTQVMWCTLDATIFSSPLLANSPLVLFFSQFKLQDVLLHVQWNGTQF